jgi:D-galactarolactone cycloisomerase
MNSLYLEFNVSSASLLNNLCYPKIEMKDGFIPVPNAPGVGVEIDQEMLERFRVL